VQALRNGPVFAWLEPALRWLGARVRVVLPEPVRVRLDRQITVAGDHWGLSAEEFVALSFVSLLAGAGLGALHRVVTGRDSLYFFLGAVAGALFPYVRLSGIEQARRKRIQNGLPNVIDLLTLGLSAGLDFPNALRHVIDKSSNPNDPLMEELTWILHELEMGKTRAQALLQFAQRAPSESVREFVSAVVQAEERGNPLAQVLQIQAESSRQRRSSQAEVAASKASVKMIGPMVLVFVAILMLIVGPMVLELKSSFSQR